MNTQNTDEVRYNHAVLNRARLMKGWTHMQLAEEMGMHYDTVRRTLTGRRTNPQTIKALAEFLGVPMEEVYR